MTALAPLRRRLAEWPPDFRRTLLQLLILLVLSALVLWYLVGAVLRLSIHPAYQVSLELPNASGIFPHAVVSYRGHQVGTVADVRLHTGGVTVVLKIDHGERIPADSTASITALSAVGEQFVNFTPTRDSGPYLHDGSVIRAGRVRTAIPVGTVLLDVDNLVKSVPVKDLQTVVDELGTAFTGTGGDLRQLLASSAQLLTTLQSVAPQTSSLVHSSGTVLDTMAATRDDLALAAQSLSQLSETLKSSDPDLRAFLDNGNLAATAVDRLVRDVGPSLGVLLGQLVTVGQIAVVRVPALQELLVALPEFGRVTPSVISDGTLNLELRINTKSPVCAYAQSAPLQSPQAPAAPLQTGAYCAAEVAPPSNIMQRGDADAPRPPGDSTDVPPPGTIARSGPATASYDPATGRPLRPSDPASSDGGLRLGWSGGQSSVLGDASWMGLLLSLVGS